MDGGDYFNVSKNSHASYAKQYLIENGLKEDCFLDCALSSNSVDDAVKIIPIIINLNNIKLIIITSDYHLDRVKIIFETILENYTMKFVGVKSNLSKNEYDVLVLHEKKATNAITQNGLYY